MKGFLAPRDCDPAVTGWTGGHYASRNERVVAGDRLFLLFPGTGGQPRDYRRLCDQAADLGCHALALRYPNDRSVNEMAAGDTRLHLALREDHWDGANRTGMVPLAEADTIRSRLVAVLEALARTRPAEGWERFLRGGEPAWERVAAAGHSLGGGYAALLARHHSLERMVAMAWSDWDRGEGRLADWIEGAWATPAERCWYLFHERDEMVPWTVAMRHLEARGAGRPVRVESEDPPWGGVRSLATDLDPSGDRPTAAPFHNSLALDVETPVFWDGSPVLADAWTWMIAGR